MRRRLALALVLPALLAAGCTAPEAPAGEEADPGASVAGSPDAPISLSVAFEDDPAALYTDAGARVRVAAWSAGSNVPVELGLRAGDGVEVLDGAPRRTQLAAADGPVVAEWRLRAEPGERVLRAWAERLDWQSAGGRAAPATALGVRGDASGAETFDPPCPRGSELPWWCGLDGLAVRLEPDPQDIALLRAVVTSPVDLAGRLYVYVPEPPGGFEVVEGATERNVTLRAGEPFVHEVRVRFPEEPVGGYFAPFASFAADPAFDARILMGYAFYAFDENGTMRVLPDAPRDPEPFGREAPDASRPEENGTGGRAEPADP